MHTEGVELGNGGEARQAVQQEHVRVLPGAHVVLIVDPLVPALVCRETLAVVPAVRRVAACLRPLLAGGPPPAACKGELAQLHRLGGDSKLLHRLGTSRAGGPGRAQLQPGRPLPALSLIHI
eukprot:15473753-Alexandrium_andersonii.AAC.1